MLAHGKTSPLASGVNGCCFNDLNDTLLDEYSTTCFSELQDDSLVTQLAGKELCSRFAPKRLSAELLSASYDRLGFHSKADRVSQCGTFLEFAFEISQFGEVSDKGKLSNANFCKDRLCPMCSWRRSYKIFAQVSKIMQHMDADYEYLFLTLTVPSVSGPELSGAIDRMIKAWFKFSHYRKISKSVSGYFRALEVTHNTDVCSKSYGLYHPHFHVVLAVPKNYFKGRGYISHDEWLNLWRKAYGDNSITQVDIRRARDKHKSYERDSRKAVDDLSSAVAEIAKYAVKPDDYIIPENWSLTDEAVSTLSSALKGRRLIAFGGCFKDVFEKLKLEDIEAADTDLVHINESLRPDLAYLIVRYGWSTGAYKMVCASVRQPEPASTNCD